MNLAIDRTSVLETALYIHSLRFNVVPTDDNKRVIGKWGKWQTERQTENDVKRIMNRSGATRVGVITGVNGLVCLDFDAMLLDGQKIEVPRNVVHKFLHHAGLPNANGLERSMSGKGWHLFLHCPNLPDDLTRVDRPSIEGSQCDHIELRAYNHQVVIVEPDVLANLNTVTYEQIIAGYEAVTIKPKETAPREYAPSDYDGKNDPSHWINKYLSCPARTDGCWNLGKQLRADGYSYHDAVQIALTQFVPYVAAKDHPFTDKEAEYQIWRAYNNSPLLPRATSGAPSTQKPVQNRTILDPKESPASPPEKYYFESGLPLALVELLLSQQKSITGDLGNAVAVEHVLHLALIGGEIETTTILSRRVIENISKTVNHPLTRRTIDNGLMMLHDLGRLHCVQNCTLINTNTIGCRNVQTLKLQSLRGWFEHMSKVLEYQVLSSYHDWLPSVDPNNDEYGYTILSEFERLQIMDVVNPDDIDNQLDRLSALSIDRLERGRAFVCPDGWQITNSKSLRIAFLKYIFNCEGKNGQWQISTYELASRLGVSERTIAAYRKEAGLNTRECFDTHYLHKDMPLEPQIKELTKGRQGGVRLYVGEFEHHYIHNGNRKQIIARAMASGDSISLVIQQPSIMYEATSEEIEATAKERSDRLAKAKERKARHNEQLELLGIETEIEVNTPPDDTEKSDNDAPLPELKAGYSKAYIYYHLKLLLDQLLPVVDKSPVIEKLLIDYGLYTPRKLEKFAFNKGIENAIIVKGGQWELAQ